MGKKRARKRHVQLTLDSARRPTGHGGWRPGAGRRSNGSRNTPHAAREEFPARIPQHVTLRIVARLPSLRCESAVGLIRTQIASSHTATFRIVHFAVEHNHLHMVVEANGKDDLSHAVRRTKIRIARRLNRALGRKGKFFAERYHSRPLTTPREVRNALCYVLNNERHHAEERGETLPDEWWDPFSSAAWFDGWASPLAVDEPSKAAVLRIPRPTALPQTWLLRTGWRRHGLLAVDEVPGKKRKR